MKKYVHYFDRIVIKEIVRLPAWIRPFMQFMTLLGQPPITIGFAAGIVGYGIARNNITLVASGTIAIATFAVSSILKVYLHRARPDNEYVRNMIIHTYSFPSGHAAGSMASFGLLVVIVNLIAPTYSLLAGILVGIICFFIGVSRVYLGAHYPSDVVGGWLVGGFGLLIIALSSIMA